MKDSQKLIEYTGFATRFCGENDQSVVVTADSNGKRCLKKKKNLKQCIKSKLLAALGYDCSHGHWSLWWPGNVTLYLEEDWSQGETVH